MKLFSAGIVLDYYDGAQSGLLRMPDGVAAFDVLWNSDDWRRRVYRLAPSSEERYRRVWDACAKWEEPRGPFWYPFGSGRIAVNVTPDWFMDLFELAAPLGDPFALVGSTAFPERADFLIALDSDAHADPAFAETQGIAPLEFIQGRVGTWFGGSSQPEELR